MSHQVHIQKPSLVKSVKTTFILDWLPSGSRRIGQAAVDWAYSACGGSIPCVDTFCCGFRSGTYTERGRSTISNFVLCCCPGFHIKSSIYISGHVSRKYYANRRHSVAEPGQVASPVSNAGWMSARDWSHYLFSQSW